MKTALAIDIGFFNEQEYERVINRCVEKSGCLLWTGCTTKYNKTGYGRINIRKRNVCPHRVVWSFKKGGIKAGDIICHSCDNPLCCNIDHMFIGSQLDNVRDMYEKGRNRHNPRKGVNAASSKLQQKDVDYIRSVYIGKDKEFGAIPLAKKFCVSRSCIYRIVHYLRYK